MEAPPDPFEVRHSELLKKIDTFSKHPVIASNDEMLETLASFKKSAEEVETEAQLSAAESYVAELERELRPT